MIIEKVIVVLNVDKEQVLLFHSYAVYQEWLIRRANCLQKLFLAVKFSKERQKEAKLERRYNLPIFSLRGALYCTKPQEIDLILKEGRKRQRTIAEILEIVKSIADPFPQMEPGRISLPIRITITEGEEAGSIYSFDSYDAYFQWRCRQYHWFTQYALRRQDRKHRKMELILAAKFQRDFDYFRGIYAVDYKNIMPIHYEELSNDQRLSTSTDSIQPMSWLATDL